MTAPLTPGAYLKYRRQAQRLALEDVAARIPTAPHIPALDRVAWLERIEADIVPASLATIEALGSAFRFDRAVLVQLAVIDRGEADHAHAPRLCRICACSWRDACLTDGEACGWVEYDLCSACVCTPAVPA